MKVLNFGSLNIDYVYEVDHIIAKGETLLSRSRNIFTGGKGLNQSVAMGRAGLDVCHAGSIGKEGEFLLDELRKARVNVDYVKKLEDTPSGHTVIQNSDDGDNCILLFGGANQQITKEQIDHTVEHFGEGDCLVLQNEINNLDYVMEKGHERKLKIVLNPSPMDAKIMKLPLQYVNLFFFNEIEASQLCGASPDDEDALIAGIREKFPRADAVLTLGSRGSVFIGRKKDGKEETFRQGIYKVKAIDTTAAGDTFSGYFLAGMAQGMSPAECLNLASCASAITVTGHGAAPSIPQMEQVKSALKPLD